MQDNVVTKLFGPLAQRYAARQGGYTRIHKFGNRRGDNAPHAILELVDNPRDLKLALTARAIGWDFLTHRLKTGGEVEYAQSNPEEAIKSCLNGSDVSSLRPLTRENLRKVAKCGFVKNKISSIVSESSEWMVRISFARSFLMI